MLMLLKACVRKPLALANVTIIGFAPSGVDGIDGHAPVASISVGDYTLHITQDHFEKHSARN